MWRCNHCHRMNMNGSTKRNFHKICHQLNLLNHTIETEIFAHAEMWMISRQYFIPLLFQQRDRDTS